MYIFFGTRNKDFMVGHTLVGTAVMDSLFLRSVPSSNQTLRIRSENFCNHPKELVSWLPISAILLERTKSMQDYGIVGKALSNFQRKKIAGIGRSPHTIIIHKVQHQTQAKYAHNTSLPMNRRR